MLHNLLRFHQVSSAGVDVPVKIETELLWLVLYQAGSLCLFPSQSLTPWHSSQRSFDCVQAEIKIFMHSDNLSGEMSLLFFISRIFPLFLFNILGSILYTIRWNNYRIPVVFQTEGTMKFYWNSTAWWLPHSETASSAVDAQTASV